MHYDMNSISRIYIKKSRCVDRHYWEVEAGGAIGLAGWPINHIWQLQGEEETVF